MERLWGVVSNSGQNVVLQRGDDVIVIDRPDEPYPRSIFLNLTPGSGVDDTIVNILISPRKLPE